MARNENQKIESIASRYKEMEAELRESEQRFRTLSEAVPQVVWASDPEGRAYYFNSRWYSYTGQTFEEAKGLGWLNTLHPEDLPRTQERWTAAVDTGTPYKVEYRIKGKDGIYRWFLSHGLPQKNEAGRIFHWFGTCTDISEHKALEETLNSASRAAEEAVRAKSEFLANMSHEIRTPMTVFMAALEHLLQIDKDPERRPFLEMAEDAAERLLMLIDDVLDFSRIEARRLDIEEEPFDMRACVHETVAMVSIQARGKNLRLETEISPEVPSRVIGDQARLGQILSNLIGNAVKFTPDGEVRVAVQVRGDILDFAVMDTGIGIPEDQREFIFQTFRQVDSSLTRKYGGTGLGLAITKGLVELMGGEIGVKRRNGGGSIFHFTLPLKTTATHRAIPAEAPTEAAGAQTRCPRILLAEDDPMVRDMIRMLLDRRGWQTETAETGREAADKWREGDFDLIFMDIHMPDMNGLEAAREIREMEKESGRHSCIIGLTADARSEIRKECLAAGMDGYLTKPVRMEALYSTIEKYLLH
jgi:PAS domain S-box-containing protein